MRDPVDALYRSFDRFLEKPLRSVVTWSLLMPVFGFGIGVFMPKHISPENDISNMLGVIGLLMSGLVFLSQKIMELPDRGEWEKRTIWLALAGGSFVFHIPFWIALRALMYYNDPWTGAWFLASAPGAALIAFGLLLLRKPHKPTPPSVLCV